MTDKIKETIFLETVNTYDHEAFSDEDLKGFIEEYEAEIELALDCYYRFDDEERDLDLIQRAWDMYNTIKQYNRPVIDGIKAVLQTREPVIIYNYDKIRKEVTK